MHSRFCRGTDSRYCHVYARSLGQCAGGKNKPVSTQIAAQTQKNHEQLRKKTARIDIKNSRAGGNDLFVHVSDPKCTVQTPAWFAKDGVGYQLQSAKGKLDIDLTCVKDGKLSIALRGLDIRDPSNSKVRIPYWINYTKFVVNGEMIFDAPHSVWHDSPYTYTKSVSDGEKLKLHIEWKAPAPDKSGTDKAK